MQKLILAPCKNHGPQEAHFFKSTEFGFMIHFCTKERTNDN